MEQDMCFVDMKEITFFFRQQSTFVFYILRRKARTRRTTAPAGLRVCFAL